MRRALKNRRCVYGGGSFRKEVINRRAFFDPRWIVVRITGEAGGGLARHEKLGKLGVTLVKLRIIGGDLLKQRYSLPVALVLRFGKADQNLHIPRLGDQLALPFGIGKILEAFGLIFFFHEARIPRADKIDDVTCYPMRAL